MGRCSGSPDGAGGFQAWFRHPGAGRVIFTVQRRLRIEPSISLLEAALSKSYILGSARKRSEESHVDHAR